MKPIFSLKTKKHWWQKDKIIQRGEEAIEAQPERTETYIDEDGVEHTTIIPAVIGKKAVEEITEQVETNFYADAEDLI